MGSTRLVGLTMLALGVFALALSFSLAFSTGNLVLLEGAMSLIVQLAVAVAVKARTAVVRLAIHRNGRLDAF